MENDTFLKEYSFSDLFDGTFKMLKFTWKNTLIISGICFVPLSLAGILLMGSYSKEWIKLMEAGMSYDSAEVINTLGTFAGAMGFGILIGIAAFLAALFVRACVVLNTFRAAHGETITLKDLTMTVLKEKLGKLVGQSILLGLIIFGAMIGGMIAVGIVGFVFTLINRGLGIFMIAMGVIAFSCLLIWLTISFSFIQEEVIYADTPVTASFKKSFFLVKGNWWRVFGILIVFGIALSFALSIITTPLTMSVLLPIYADMLERFIDGGSMSDFYSSLFSVYSKAQIPLFISSLVTYIVTYLFSPVFTSLFYIDLKIRKKEIPLEPGPTPEETETGGQYQEMTDSDQQ